MNAKQLIAVLLTAAAGAAAAQTPAPAPTAGVTRAEVIAEFMRARAAGELPTSETNYPATPVFVSKLTRAQVIAELLEARKNGEIPLSEANLNAVQSNKQLAKSPD